MAERQGVSKSTVSDIWRSHNLKPHRVKSFKLSRDPHFLEKLTDVVGLYLNPPRAGDRAVCGREEPDSGARSHAAGTAAEEGRCGTMTHDYKRNGTTCLFAALGDLCKAKSSVNATNVIGIRSS